MQRIVSFVILVALVLVIGFFFFQVMAVFILPMFFAGILVVIFRPLHLRLVERCGGRERIAAGLSTLTILAIVLVPLSILVVRAGMDGYDLAERIDAKNITVGQLRSQFGIASPPENVVNALGDLRNDLEQARNLYERWYNPYGNDESNEDLVPDVNEELARASQYLAEIKEYLADYRRRKSKAKETAWDNPDSIVDLDEAGENIDVLELDLKTLNQLSPKVESDKNTAGKFSIQLIEANNEARSLQENILGNSLMRWIKAHGNLDVDELKGLVATFASPNWVVAGASRVGGTLANVVIGLVVTLLSLYYFLADGPAMVETVMQLSPLDDRYELAMLTEFDRISRAVVVATLLSALVQGLLAGIGYYFAGLGSVFLLTMLTMMMAMVPFVGAASVWGGCCLYLLLVGEPWTAALLAVYGACVVSLVDNVIKPMVLHGQSNLHPLLALVSVLGGAKALGPIGILVGPMVVAFLQAVLNMLKVEITEFEDGDQASLHHPADDLVKAISNVGDNKSDPPPGDDEQHLSPDDDTPAPDDDEQAAKDEPD